MSRWAVLAFGWVLAALGAAPASAGEDRFRQDCEALTRAPHRLSGTPECRAAADHIEKRLREIGADAVLVQEFPSLQTQVKRCVLEVEGRPPVELLPARPNGIIPPVTPPGGLAGQLLDLGAGGLGDFADRSPRGKIVVMDYNAGRGWMRAFRLGAKAVVFVGRGPARAWHAHYVHANANLPRFFYAGRREDLPDGARAVLHSEVTWAAASGRNVFGFFRGTEPTFHLEKEEVIVVAANLDSFGEVPRRSPGARGAANCAAVLRLAQHIKGHRPSRHVLLAFLDNQARGHAGCAALYRALERDTTSLKLANRATYLENEKGFLEKLRALVEREDPLGEDSPVRRELVTRLKRCAASRSYDVGTTLHELRADQAEREPDSAEHAELARRIDAARAEKDRWNDLRRALARGTGAEGVRAELDAAVAQVRRNVANRASELATEERALEADRALSDLVGDHAIVLHVSMLLGDTSPRWGLVIGGDSRMHSWNDLPGLYGKIQATFLGAFEALKEEGAAPPHFETASADGSLEPPSLLWAAPFLVHSGEVAGRLGIYSLALATSQESLLREGTPDDTLANLDLARIEQQASEIGPLLGAAASRPGLSLRSSITVDKFFMSPEFGSDGRPAGPSVMGRLVGTSLPDQPMPNVVVQIRLAPRGEYPFRDLLFETSRIYAFDEFLLLRTNQNGYYGFGPVQSYVGSLRGFAADFDERGEVTSASDLTSAREVLIRLNTFQCRPGAVVVPPQLDARPARVLRAKGNSSLEDGRSFYQTLDGVVHWYCERKIEAVKLFGVQSTVSLVSGGETLSEQGTADPEGVGTSMEGTWELPASAARAGADLWRLNESRLAVLRRRGILNSSVEELHGRAEDLLIEAAEREAVVEREALAASAYLAERPVYDQTLALLNDLVHAVLVLLGLCVPFAFALERLLIGATTVYRQIAWFAGFFSATFLILFFTHPAFAISKTPIIIFLGFTIVVLASLVIVIIMRRFEAELKVLQGLTTTVHAADVSRFSTVMAAMSMGISTMRRRPLRTALTATTIVMLTFTILWFASFGMQTGVVKLFVGPSPGHAGALLHRVNWSELNESVLDIVQARWGGQAAVCTRYWVSPRTEQNQGPLITREDGAGPLAVRGVLGLDAAELEHRPDLAELFRVDAAEWPRLVLMTEAVAEQMQVAAGDTVLVGGIRLQVGPLLNATAISAAKDLDGNGILPVDFVEMQSALGATTSQEQALAAQGEQNWAYLPTNAVILVASENARRMGAALHAVALYTRDTRSATVLAEDAARVLPIPVSATRRDGVYRHVLGTLVQASGAGDLFFPILLGGLVIFGTMLGSVADREKEIYTFSSLGLAPPHVASLFFAEALVYSVLGGLAGYLLAQAAMAVLSALADYGLVRVPEMNYSSANAIITMLLVMGTVLVSAVYPAIKASRSANPGILRTWRLPQPKGDVLDIVFPFTVSEYDITGVVSFLKEHFDNFGDTGLGVFMARDARLVRGSGGALGLAAELALAPFDLGVTQTFDLASAPSEIPGIDEVAITITRLSGQPKDWARLNKVLLDDLRRQFLIWRALPQETMEIYRERTLVAMGGGQAESGGGTNGTTNR